MLNCLGVKVKIRSVGLSQLWLQGFLDFVQELENGGPIEVEPEPMLAEEDMEVSFRGAAPPVCRKCS